MALRLKPRHSAIVSHGRTREGLGLEKLAPSLQDSSIGRLMDGDAWVRCQQRPVEAR